jgi:hypothetical protein
MMKKMRGKTLMSREGHNYWECALHGDSLSADKLDRGRHTTLSGGAMGGLTPGLIKERPFYLHRVCSCCGTDERKMESGVSCAFMKSMMTASRNNGNQIRRLSRWDHHGENPKPRTSTSPMTTDLSSTTISGRSEGTVG